MLDSRKESGLYSAKHEGELQVIGAEFGAKEEFVRSGRR